MKFLNLETGYSFDALWNKEQEKGYIFWFKNEQSIGLIYTMPVAFITESNSPITLSIEDNDIFSFITLDSYETLIDGYKFDGKPQYSNTIETEVNETPVNGKYIHYFNVACKSDNVGEYICRINIGDKGYIRVGADFYGEHEPIYINLSNMGIELPTTIQKTIYDTNVHEDITNHILINRKFKELLSNYWDIIANKGSYKSLLNSLEWFEWNDHLIIKEIYRKDNGGKLFYLDKDIINDLNNNIELYANNFIKTTYISLYCSLQNELPTYDNELNPVLEQAVFKWCKEDIQLKIALLAKFFGVHFLPIHLSILQASVEDKVFTNTIKNIHGNFIVREDNIGSFDTINCSIKDNDTFCLSNVQAQVTNSTIFGVQYPNTEVFGVDIFPAGDIKTDNELKTFSQQYYTGPGAIIPIELILSKVNQKDFIKETIIKYTDDSDTWKQLKFNTVFRPENNTIKIPFNFLAKVAKKYILQFTFILGSSQTISKKIYFNVEDIDNVNINIYKVQSKNNLNGFTYDDFNIIEKSSKYLFKIQNTNSNKYYTQYLPYLNNYDNNYKGIKLNKTTIFQVLNDINTTDLNTIINNINGDDTSFIDNNFLYFIKQKNNNITYITFVSRYFNTDNSEKLINNAINITYNNKKILKAIRNDYVFYPQFHELKKIEGDLLEDYTIKPYEAICVAAEMINGNNITEFKYGHLINSTEWSFYNHLTNTNIIHPTSSQAPFIADSNKLLENGYYDITFKYSLNNGYTKEYNINSAFVIKD